MEKSPPKGHAAPCIAKRMHTVAHHAKKAPSGHTPGKQTLLRAKALARQVFHTHWRPASACVAPLRAQVITRISQALSLSQSRQSRIALYASLACVNVFYFFYRWMMRQCCSVKLPKR